MVHSVKSGHYTGNTIVDFDNPIRICFEGTLCIYNVIGFDYMIISNTFTSEGSSLKRYLINNAIFP